MCLRLCWGLVWAQLPAEARTDCWSNESWVTGDAELPDMSILKLNLGSVQKQHILLAAEPSL